MNGSDFYTLAIALQSAGGPAELRSATGRAYYGAFHRASEMLLSIGIRLPAGPECYTKIRMILSQARDTDVIEAADKLNSLRTRRNKADYDLTDPAPEVPKTVSLNLARARQIIDCIDACFPGKPKASIHAELRSYARDTLRLDVR